MIRTRLGKFAAIASSLLCSALLAILVVPALTRTVEARLSSSIDQVSAFVTGRTGLVVGYDAIILASGNGIRVDGLRFTEPAKDPDTTARELLSVGMVTIRVDLLAALAGKTDRIVRRVDLDDVAISLRFPGDQATLARLFAPGDGTPAALPLFAAEVGKATLDLSLQDGTRISGDLSGISWSSLLPSPSFELRESSLRVALPGQEAQASRAGIVANAVLDARGIASEDFSLISADVGLAVEIEGRALRIGRQAMQLRVGGGAVELLRAGDDGLDLSARYDTAKAELEGTARLLGFRLASLAAMDGAAADLKALAALPVSGELTFGLRDGAPRYRGVLVARGEKSVLLQGLKTEGISAELVAEGDATGLSSLRLAAKSNGWELGYEGRLTYGDMGLDGRIWARRGADGGEARVAGAAGRYAAEADRIGIATGELRRLGFGLESAGGRTRLSLTAVQPRATETEDDGRLALEATLEGDRADLGFTFADLRPAGLASMIGSLRITGMPALPAIPPDLVLSGKGTAVNDRRGLRWAAERLEARAILGTRELSLRASGSGDLAQAALDALDLRYGATAVSAQGILRYGTEPGFEGTIEYAGQRYRIAASYASDTLRVTGSHGLAVEARREEGGAWRASLEAADLPVALGEGLLVAGVKAEARYAGADDWRADIASFRLRYGPSGAKPAGAQAFPEISGGEVFLRPGTFRFGNIEVNGEGYGLSGPATLTYAIPAGDGTAPVAGAAFPAIGLAATLRGRGALGAGTAVYDIRADLAEGNLNAGIGFSAFPLGAADKAGARSLDAAGYLRVRGPLDLARLLQGAVPDPEAFRGDLSVSLAGPGLQMAEQRLRVRYAGGALLADLDDSGGGLSGTGRIRLDDQAVTATVALRKFVPSSVVRLGAADPAVQGLLSMSLSGSLGMELRAGGLRYRADLAAEGAKGGKLGPLETGGLSLALTGTGDEKGFSALDVRIAQSGWTVGYEGTLGFDGLRVAGEARLSRAGDGGRIAISGSDGTYRADDGTLRFGAAALRGLNATLRAAADGYDLTLSARLEDAAARADAQVGTKAAGQAGTRVVAPAGTQTDAPGSFRAEGHFGAANAGVGLEFSDIDPARVRAFVAAIDLPGLRSLPEIPAGIRLSGTVFAESDFKKIAWNAMKLSGEMPLSGKVLRFEATAAGDLREARIKSITLSRGEQRGSLSGLLRFSGPIAFDGTLSYAGVDYPVNATYAGGALSLTGGYGLVADARPDGKGGWEGRVEAAELPVGLGQGRAVASLRANGRFAGAGDWKLLVERFTLRYEPAVPQPAGSLRLPELAGEVEFQPGLLRFGRLELRDERYGLSGPVTLAYRSAAEGLIFDLAGELANIVDERERYTVKASLSGGRIAGTVQVAGFPVERVPGLPIRGDLEGIIEFDGPFDLAKLDLANLPELRFKASLNQGEYRAMPLKASASGSFHRSQFRVHDISASWQGNTLSDANAEILLDQRRASFQAGYRGVWGSQRVTARLFASIEVPEADAGVPGAAGGIPPFNFAGSFESMEIAETKLRDWGFSGTYSGEGIRFEGGGGQVQLSWTGNGDFSVTMKEPFPVRVQALGTIGESGIDAVLAGLDLDLAQFAPLLEIKPVTVRKGRLYGDFAVRGSLADPEITGTAYVLGGVVELNELVSGVSEPFDLEVLLSGREIEAKPTSIPIGGGIVDASATARLESLQLRDLTLFLTSRSRSTLDIDGRILGVSVEKGKGSIDLSLGISEERIDIGGKVLIEKGDVLINPGGFIPAQGQAASSPAAVGPYLRVNADFTFGKQVQAYLPSKDIPLISGSVDPASAVSLRFDSDSGDLRLDGSLYIKSGYLLFYLRNFFVKSALVTFAETAQKFDPLVTASAELRETNQEGPVIISLELKDSPISDLRPRLSSMPSMPESQLIALMSGGVLSTTSAQGTVGIREAVIASSEFLPQFNLYKSFENRVRQQLGLDVVYLRSTFLQRWLLDISKPSGEPEPDDPLARYLDKSELYVGKYIGNAAFLHGSVRLREDPLVAASQLRLDSEIGIELDSPFGILSWSLSPGSGDGALVEGQKLSLSWRIPY